MIREETANLMRLRDAEGAVLAMGDREEVSSAVLNRMDMGSGVVTATLELPRALFYSTVSERCGLEIRDDGDLIDQLTQMAAMKRSYEKVEEALHQVEATGYGIVMPDPQEMTLEEPEIVKQGGRYGVRLKASAPSIHMMRADIRAEVSPIMGTEKQSEEMVTHLPVRTSPPSPKGRSSPAVPPVCSASTHMDTPHFWLSAVCRSLR